MCTSQMRNRRKITSGSPPIQHNFWGANIARLVAHPVRDHASNPLEHNMIRTTLLLAAAATLIPAAHAQDPCSLLTPDQIKAVVSTPVNPGTPGGTKDSPDCTWKDAKGEDRVYVSLKTRDNYNVVHAQMQASGRLVAVTGVGEDAFFVTSPAGSTSYLYALGKHHLLLLQINIPNASRQDNQAAEKGLATEILPKL
jgi:hypothetical protein